MAEVSSRLGVSSHSLYQWVKAVTPDKTEKQASELIEAKSEILKLRAQLQRTEEERDIPKKSRGGTLRGRPAGLIGSSLGAHHHYSAAELENLVEAGNSRV